MKRHTRNEQHQQFAETERVIETCIEFLSDDQVKKVSLGLAECALELLDLLYVPNQVDGVYRITNDVHGGKGIPFVMAPKGERIRIQRNIEHALHPFQLQRLHESFEKIERQSLTNEHLSVRIDVLRESHGEEFGDIQVIHDDLAEYDACVYAPTTVIGLGGTIDTVDTYATHTSPVIVGRREKLLVDEGDMLYHEIIHGYQSLQGNLVQDGSKYARDARPRAELEAYWGQALALEARTGIRIDEEKPHNWNCYGVESVRRHINHGKKDPFKVTKKLLQAIERDGSRLM